jgi:sugar/nucleoside kinase (ribokinase family)
MGLLTAEHIGPIEYARSFTLGMGGAQSSVAIGVARLGGAASWIGRLGRDAAGDLIERRLQSERVSVLAVRDQAFTALIDGETFEMPAVPVRVVDQVRAGGAFVAAYLADLLAG